MAKKSNLENETINLEGLDVDPSDLSGHGKGLLENLKFVDLQIMQKHNELQIADSARIMYSSVLNAELKQTKT
jgi:hypothetical protein